MATILTDESAKGAFPILMHSFSGDRALTESGAGAWRLFLLLSASDL